MFDIQLIHKISKSGSFLGLLDIKKSAFHTNIQNTKKIFLNIYIYIYRVISSVQARNTLPSQLI